MIYDPRLETFITVADTENINKAAQQLKFDNDTIEKELNELESEVGVKLFKTKNTDIKLTKAGNAFYRDVKKIIEACKEAVERAQFRANVKMEKVRIGTSPITPTIELVNLWPEIERVCPNIEIEIVPFEKNPKNASEILDNLGNEIDMVFGMFDDTLNNLEDCSILKLSEEPLLIAIPSNHPYKSKDSLTIDDLDGEKLMLVKPGWSSTTTKLREDLAKNHPNTEIIDLDYYDVDTFRYCDDNGILLPVIKQTRGSHPLTKMLPIEWDYTVPFGILYSKNPTETTKKLINAFKEVAEHNDIAL